MIVGIDGSVGWVALNHAGARYHGTAQMRVVSVHAGIDDGDNHVLPGGMLMQSIELE